MFLYINNISPLGNREQDSLRVKSADIEFTVANFCECLQTPNTLTMKKEKRKLFRIEKQCYQFNLSDFLESEEGKGAGEEKGKNIYCDFCRTPFYLRIDFQQISGSLEIDRIDSSFRQLLKMNVHVVKRTLGQHQHQISDRVSMECSQPQGKIMENTSPFFTFNLIRETLFRNPENKDKLLSLSTFIAHLCFCVEKFELSHDAKDSDSLFFSSIFQFIQLFERNKPLYDLWCRGVLWLDSELDLVDFDKHNAFHKGKTYSIFLVRIDPYNTNEKEQFQIVETDSNRRPEHDIAYENTIFENSFDKMIGSVDENSFINGQNDFLICERDFNPSLNDENESYPFLSTLRILREMPSHLMATRTILKELFNDHIKISPKRFKKSN